MRDETGNQTHRKKTEVKNFVKVTVKTTILKQKVIGGVLQSIYCEATKDRTN